MKSSEACWDCAFARSAAHAFADLQLREFRKVGTGHVFVSTDAGETFTDVSGDLVDAPANWVEVQSGKLLVGTDVGVFISSGLTGGTYSRLGDLPAVPVVHLTRDPSNASRIVVSTFGRGLYAYTFE